MKDMVRELTERRVCLSPDKRRRVLSGGVIRMWKSGGRLQGGSDAVNDLSEEASF
jgi:hypothetical protein